MQNLQENTSARVSFSITLHASGFIYFQLMKKRKTWTSQTSKGRPEFAKWWQLKSFYRWKNNCKETKSTLWLTTQDNRENKITYKRKSPGKWVYTENLEANQKEAEGKPRENIQKENVNEFLLPVPVMTEH